MRDDVGAEMTAGEFGGMEGGTVFIPGVPSLALRAWMDGMASGRV